MASDRAVNRAHRFRAQIHVPSGADSVDWPHPRVAELGVRGRWRRAAAPPDRASDAEEATAVGAEQCATGTHDDLATAEDSGQAVAGERVRLAMQAVNASETSAPMTAPRSAAIEP